MEFAELIRIPRVENVILHRHHNAPIEGTLCITGHHMILSSRQQQKEELWLLHKNIDTVDKKLSGASGTLYLKCKDFQVLQLDIPRVEDCVQVALTVEQLSNIENTTLSYPFFYRAMFDILEDGWQAFMPEMEFNQMKKFIGGDWRISNINRNYEVCSSYPHLLVVPKTVDDETLVLSARFRQGGRFPVLSYYHKDNQMVIMRTSQPLTGPNSKRCREDETLVNAVLGIGRKGFIVDTRSQTQAKLATAKGGGVEPELHYSQWRRLHQSVDRHTALHDAIIKLMEASTDGSISADKWLSRLESSNWLGHVKDNLTCACVIAQCIDKEGASVLVHGTEGTDTTLTVTSLAQIVLDPDCRTVRGFEALVEREWIQAGHPFTDRCVKAAFATTKSQQEAPVFLLFLDCVWQIWQQFPCSFEFNEDFLQSLFKNAYASQFGTFLGNNEHDRKRLKLIEKTTSLWSWVNRPEVLTQFLNPLYEPNNSILWPSVAPQSLQLWTSLYQPWQKHLVAEREIWDEIKHTKEYDKELKTRVIKLRKHLVNLEREAVELGLIAMPGQ